jgi:hypothetical protein
MSLSSLTRWFGGRSRRPAQDRVPTARLHLESLERREVPAFVGGRPDVSSLRQPVPQSDGQVRLPVGHAAAASLGQAMAAYLQARLGTRVGGGECAHLVSEALRVAGAEFIRTEPAGTRDYVWTSNRVARLTNGSQVAVEQFSVGDIIQYDHARFSDGSELDQHTQVVAAVDPAGRVTQVYEQNVGGQRTVHRAPAPDWTKLTGGSVTVYRAVPRTPQSGRVEFTVVNNTNTSRTWTLQIGSGKWNSTLDRANTAGSYLVGVATASAGARPMLVVGNASVEIQDGAGYELYTLANGQVGIRQV